MKTLFAAVFLGAWCALVWSAAAQAPPLGDALATLDLALAGTPDPDSASPDRPRELAPELSLDDVERIALSDNPEIHVAVRRVEMAQAHVPTAGALDDPQFMYRGWQVPLKHPWDYNGAQNMFMLSQNLPGPGKRGIENSIAQTDVQSETASLEAPRLRVRIDVRKAFYDLLLAQEELNIHNQHVAIASQAIEAARIKYTTGKVPQQDMLKAQLALTRLAEHMIRFDHDAEVAQTHIDTLLGRDPATPIRVRCDFNVAQTLPT